MKLGASVVLPLVSVVIVLLLAGVLLVHPVETGSPQQVDSSTEIATTSNASCMAMTEVWGPNSDLTYPNSNGTYSIPVLIMQPGTTGYICAIYESPPQIPQNLTIGTVDSSCGCHFVVSQSFAINATRLDSTQPLTDQANATYQAILYSVTALANSKGFYDSSAPFGCWAFPMAVGYSAADVNSSDFPSYIGVSAYRPCGPVAFVAFVSVSGIQTTVVQFPQQ